MRRFSPVPPYSGRASSSLLVLVLTAAAPVVPVAAETRAGDGIGDQWNVVACSDGAGGAFFVWMDRRSSSTGIDLVAQRFDAGGAVVAGWPAAGVPLVAVAGDQIDPRCIADDAGGAWVVWTDLRSGADIRATRLSAGGLAAGWPADGAIVCAAMGAQTDAVLAADGDGGAWVTWTDRRSDGGDIYAQRLRAGGPDPAWPVDGAIVCDVAGTQQFPAVTGTANGAAMVVWENVGGGNGRDLWAQRLRSDGARAWFASGVQVCVAAGDQDRVRIVADATGGGFIFWQDQRYGEYDLFVLRLSQSGERVFPWPIDGIPVCLQNNAQFEPEPAADGMGGAYVTWFDRRASDADVFAQRIDVDGRVVAGWPGYGARVCDLPGDQTRPLIAVDAGGRPWIAWTDLRDIEDGDVAVQRLDGYGGIAGCWPVRGTTFEVADDQRAPALVPAGSGALLAWVDRRAQTDTDIWVAGIDAEPLGSWAAPSVEVTAAGDGESFFSGAVASDGGGGAFIAWEDARNGDVVPWLQHLDAGGTPSAGWPPGGVALSARSGAAGGTRVVTVAGGGVYVAWHEGSTTHSADVFVQHFDAGGAIAPGWPAGGRSVADVAGGVRTAPSMVADGAGGVVVAWQEWDGVELDVRAQRLTAAGGIAPGWPGGGRVVCAVAGAQGRTAMSVIQSGFLIAWQDDRAGPASDVYALALTPSGGLVSNWALDGAAVCRAPGLQHDVRVASDGAGGAFVAWRDRRAAIERMYASRILSNSTRADGWRLDGEALDAGDAAVRAIAIAADTQGGLLATWATAGAAPSVRVARRAAGGAVPAGWPQTPRVLRPGVAFTPAIAGDGSGGAVVAWVDGRSDEADLYAQHIDPGGRLVGATGGAPVCVESGAQQRPALVGTGGCPLAVWRDERGGAARIFAARLSSAILAAPGYGGDAVLTAAADALRVASHRPPPPQLQVGPNPMRSRTRFLLRGVSPDSPARITIFDARGRVVRRMQAADGVAHWEGDDSDGRRVAAGTYLVQARAASGVTAVAKVWVQR